MGFRIDRRTVLWGTGGIAVGLPVLDAMLDSNGNRLAAQGRAIPKRYALLLAGQAIGGDGMERDNNVIGGERRREGGHFVVPPTEGRGYEINTALESVRGVVDDFTLVSGLKIPFNRNSTDGSAVPAGGAYRDFHGGGKSPLLSGTRSDSATFVCNGPTSDQVIADLNDGDTTFRSLVFRAQVPFYLSGYDHSGRQYISYREGGRSGRIEAQTSPRNAYMSLFTGFIPDDDTTAAARLDYELRSRRSVLDLVLGKRDRLLTRVGTADRRRLEQYFDELRALEQRIAAIPPMTGGACEVPPDPGADPAIGGDNTGAGSGDIRPGTGYSDEHLRARVFADMIHMAFACDLTRAATLQITAFQSHMSVLPITTDLGFPARADLHELGHNGDSDNRGQFHVSLMLQWHLSHYAYLIEKMRDTPEGDGNLLDNSVIVFTPEAGHGIQLNDASSMWQTHSVEDMVLFVAGRAGGLDPGRHIRVDDHPAKVLVSAMQAAGYQGDSLGEVTGNVPALFG